MKHPITLLLAAALVLTTGCTPEQQAEAPKAAEADAGGATTGPLTEALDATPTETGTAAGQPSTAPVVAPTDPLMLLSCADFLATAKIAATQPADDAALAAQDELVNGLTWVHGYLYAKNDGKYDVLSQEWIEVTAKRVFGSCTAAKDPKTTNLFEVATS